MSFWVYILRCSDGTYYTGHTDDLERRIAQHQSGALPGYTHERRPVELMFSETFTERIDALERERQIKDWSRKKKEALIAGDWGELRKLASRSKALRDETASPSAVCLQQPLRGIAASPQGERVAHSGNPVHAEEGLKAPSRSTKPVIVLVRPQLGENIGKAARAML
ncbi:MAG: GIY-YIG nuclease family protein, partial [Sphingobium sp.]